MDSAIRIKYRAKIKRIERTYNRLETEALKTIYREATALRRQILGELADLTVGDIDRRLLNQSLQSINAMIDSHFDDIATAIGRIMEDFGELGTAEGEIIADLFNLDFVPVSFPTQLQASAEYTADLISTISGDTQRKVERFIKTLAFGAAGETRTFELRKGIIKILGGDGRSVRKGKVTGAAFQLERITRTEVSRIYSLTNQMQAKAMNDQIPDLMKVWLANVDGRERPAHRLANRQKRHIDKAFDVGGEKLMYPLDPAGSAKNTVFCRCRSRMYSPSLMGEGFFD